MIVCSLRNSKFEQLPFHVNVLWGETCGIIALGAFV